MTPRRTSFVFLWIALSVSGCGSSTPIAPAPITNKQQALDLETDADGTSPESPSIESLPSASQTGLSLDDQGAIDSESAPVPMQSGDSFREPDFRTRHDAERLASIGIDVYESPRLRLYTDIDPETAQTLPPLVDVVFDEWQDYFGPLPPARDGSDFQLSAYVMRDQERFREAGLLPANLPVFSHGKHQGQEFWMNDQQHAYYLRHLLLHEATHCFMQAMGGTTLDVPLWYLEGMAELFATHTLDEEGRPTFRVVPARPDEFVGFSRIEMIRQDVEQGEAFTMSQLGALSPQEIRRRQSAYAWSWALCLLADRNPRYRKVFQDLGRQYPAEGFAETYASLIAPVAGDFEAEWTLFTREAAYGFDLERASVPFQRGMPLSGQTREHRISVAADCGWQASGVEVAEGDSYRVSAEGRVTLAEVPKPWGSEPDGVTIRYCEGHPLGRLVGVIISEPEEAAGGTRFLSEVISLGRETSLTAQASGTLYLRVNDFWSELADNKGEYSVLIEPSRRDSGTE